MCSIGDLVYFNNHVQNLDSPVLAVIYNNRCDDQDGYFHVFLSSCIIQKLRIIDTFLLCGLSIEAVLIANDGSRQGLEKILENMTEKLREYSYDRYKKRHHLKMDACDRINTILQGYASGEGFRYYSGTEINEGAHDESASHYQGDQR